jgi:hypothetical protein
VTVHGNDIDGFVVTATPATRTVHVRLWGFWPVEVAVQFVPSVAAACQEMGGVNRLEVDANELKPLREEGQIAFGGLLAQLPLLKVAHASISTTNALTRLQLMRLVKQSPAKGLVQMTSPRAA